MNVITPRPTLSRRGLIRTGLTVAGGLAIGLVPAGRALAATVPAEPWDKGDTNPYDLDAWVAVEPDGRVLIRYTRSEMGQGSMTALPMLVAEELDCDWAAVRVEYGSPGRSLRENNIYGDMSSVGSHSVKESQLKMRQVGASGRARLIAAAAAHWGIEPATCTAAAGVVTDPATGRTLRYAELGKAAAAIHLAAEPALKSPDQYKIVGKPTNRIDVPLKVNGAAQYAMDVCLPGMAYAAIMACPVPGGTLARVDDAPAKGMPGFVAVVRLPNAVAVVAEGTWWRAKQALARLQPEWNTGTSGSANTAQFNREYQAVAAAGPAAVARNDGNAERMLAGSNRVLEATYEVPLLAHAPMEPMNATVAFRDDILEVWVGTQSADRTLKLAANTAGLRPDQVVIHNTFVGGGFGRRSTNDDMVQAIRVAQAVKRPVKLIWTREEDIRQDRFRPQAALTFRGTLGADGMPAAWSIRTGVGSLMRSLGMSVVANGLEPMAIEGLVNNPYAVPNTLVQCVLKNTHIPVAFWRSVGASQNAFAIESFIDEMAAAAGKDPYQFRRTLLAGKEDWLRVLDTAAEKGGWGKPIGPGRARGIAIHEAYGTVVSEVVEITLQKGELKVDKVTVALDCGHVVNPLSVAEQMEGGVIYALSAALFGKITVKNGAIEQGNFDTYQMVRYAQAPKIDVHFALSGGTKWGGAGEPGAAPVAAAVCNAIFTLTGKRIRSLPIMDHDLTTGV